MEILSERLESNDAQQAINTLETNILTFLSDCNDCFTKEDRIFLWQSLEVPDKFSYFYITAKVHKNPWKPRPITSMAGSITHGLGRWVNQELKLIVHKLPSYIKSSKHLLKRLKNTTFDPSNVSFFSCDAVSMYTNIDTNQALEVLQPFLSTSPLCAGCPANTIITALDILMRQNVFKLGDTYWKQNSGTTMGTPPDAYYAGLYYAAPGISSLPQTTSITQHSTADTSAMASGSGSIIQTPTLIAMLLPPSKRP
jgi:hypothetical protein